MSQFLAPMLDLARGALANAHAPYSGFRVGACIRAGSGRLYAGCNVENASYPVTQCAEASAVGAMVSAGDRLIVEAVIVSEGDEPCAPCGRCRQQLAEFAGPDMQIHLCGPEGVRVTATLGELFPMAFGRTPAVHPEPPSPIGGSREGGAGCTPAVHPEPPSPK